MTCAKRRYASESAAHWAHRKAGYRIRVYRCECGWLHVGNADKTPPVQGFQPSLGRSRKTYLHPEAPVLTLEQVQAIAAEKRRGAA